MPCGTTTTEPSGCLTAVFPSGTCTIVPSSCLTAVTPGGMTTTLPSACLTVVVPSFDGWMTSPLITSPFVCDTFPPPGCFCSVSKLKVKHFEIFVLHLLIHDQLIMGYNISDSSPYIAMFEVTSQLILVIVIHHKTLVAKSEIYFLQVLK